MPETVRFHHIAIAAHPLIDKAWVEANLIVEYLQISGINATAGLLYDDHIVEGIAKNDFDLVIALGGDGTMLRTGNLCAPHDIPILGINLGSLGFLMEISEGEWPQVLPQLLDGNYWIETRMMLRAQHVRDEQGLEDWVILNEAVVGRGEIMRPVKLSAKVDGFRLATYTADGLIAATPTGSTAYALAAGGPILPPDLRNILLVPVAPHLSVDRAIVLAEGSAVEIQVHTRHAAALSIDGHTAIPLEDGDIVRVKSCEFSAKFVRLQAPGYFYRNLTSQMNHHDEPAIRKE